MRRDTSYLPEMFKLRRQGNWSSPALAVKFNKDHSTILYHCKKHGVEPMQEGGKIEKPKKITRKCKNCPVQFFPQNRMHIFCSKNCNTLYNKTHEIIKDADYILDERGERVCVGKSYKDYFKEAYPSKKERARIMRCMKWGGSC